MEVHLSFWNIFGIGSMFAVIVALLLWCITLLHQIANPYR
jgi:hypothetical protein